jgi:hypothetical protein
MATTRRRRIKAHRDQQLRAREVNRRRDATAHARPVQGFSVPVVKAMAWTALLLLGAALLLVLIG